MSCAPSSPAPTMLLCDSCKVHLRACVPDAQPLSLSCGHAICRACADATASATTPCCPFCYKAIVAPGALNAGLAALAESMYQAAACGASCEEPRGACAECAMLDGADVPADSKCEDCRDRLLCDAHVTSHQKRGHSVVTLRPQPKPAAAAPMCPLHPTQPLQLFCSTDTSLLCDTCMASQHTGPGHVCVTLLTAAGTLAQRAVTYRAAAQAAQSVVPNLRAAKASLQSTADAVCVQYSAVLAGVKGKVDSVQRRWTEALRQACVERVKQLDAAATEAEVTAGQLQVAAMLCEGGRGAADIASALPCLASADLLAQKTYNDSAHPSFMALSVDTAAVEDALVACTSLRLFPEDPEVSLVKVPELLQLLREKEAEIEELRAVVRDLCTWQDRPLDAAGTSDSGSSSSSGGGGGNCPPSLVAHDTAALQRLFASSGGQLHKAAVATAFCSAVADACRRSPAVCNGVSPDMCRAVVTTLSAHGGDGPTVTQALRAVQALCGGTGGGDAPAALHFDALFRDVCPLVVTALTAHMNDAEVLLAALRCVSSLLLRGVAAAQLVAAGVAPLVLGAMSSHHSHEGVQAAALETCVAFVRCSEAQQAQLASLLQSPPHLVTAALKTHPSSAAVQLHGLTLLAVLCRGSTTAYQCDALADGAIDAVLNALATHSSHTSVQTAVCEYMGCLVGDAPRLLAPRMVAGGLRSVCRLLSTQPSVQSLVGAALTAMQVVAPLAPDTFASCDGVKCVLSVMDLHRSVPLLQVQSCGVLTALVPVASATAVMTADTVCRVFAAMDAHLLHRDLQVAACNFLEAIVATGKPALYALLRVDGLPRVARAVKLAAGDARLSASHDAISAVVSMLCPAGHRTQKMPTKPAVYSGVWACDLCRLVLPNAARGVAHCPTCRWDCCVACQGGTLCPGGHPLVPLAATLSVCGTLPPALARDTSLPCGVCRGRADLTTSVYCLPCSFALCGSCKARQTCAVGHCMTAPAAGLSAAMRCDLCGAAAVREGSLHCGPCDYDVCWGCRGKRFCPRTHVTSAVDSMPASYRGWGCDLCKANIPMATRGVQHCAMCRFDVCLACQHK